MPVNTYPLKGRHLVPANDIGITVYDGKYDEASTFRNSDIIPIISGILIDATYLSEVPQSSTKSRAMRVTNICFSMWTETVSILSIFRMTIHMNNTDNPPCQSVKILLLGIAVLNGIPVVSAALTMSHGFRIASGVSSSASAIVVIPLRTLDGIPVAAYTMAYIVWAVCFSTYLWLQLKILPSGLGIRRKLYLFCVFTAAIHFSVALSQNSKTIHEGVTVYGPIILTVCTYLMSLLFGGHEVSEVQANPDAVISAALGQ